jgi:hypothetical protein
MMVNVTFVGEYFALTTCIAGPQNVEDYADHYDEIVEEAASLIKWYYGWDVLDAANIEIEVEA